MVEEPNRIRYSVTVRFLYTDSLNELVERGLYMDNQDAIRRALQDLFEKHGVEEFMDKREPKTIERKRIEET